MIILICGAEDVINDYFPVFDEIVRAMEFQPEHFDKLNPNASQYATNVEKSVTAINSSDMIVFVIKEKSGVITWSNEYVQAINQGKPFIILVQKFLHDSYYKRYKAAAKGANFETDVFFDAFKTLDTLLTHHRNVVSFENTIDFKKELLKGILNELRNGTTALQEFNRRKSLTDNIKNDNYWSFLTTDIGQPELAYLKRIAFDIFENKEVRKRIIKFFSSKKNLMDDEIITLLNDTEQGIVRAVTDQLSELIGPDNNKEALVNNLISIVEDTDDTGTIRRAIASVFAVDIKIAVIKLQEIFPAHDIGTAKRIVKWLIDHPEKIKPHLGDKKFIADMNKLKSLSENYSQKGESLKDLCASFDDMLIELKKTP